MPIAILRVVILIVVHAYIHYCFSLMRRSIAVAMSYIPNR